MKQAVRLVYAPNSIFRKKATPVSSVNAEVRNIVDSMFEIMYEHGAVGFGANMVGVLQRIAVVDLQENGAKQPYVFINPKIVFSSTETQTFEEGSLSYPGIKTDITRLGKIELEYLDYEGKSQVLTASEWFATVIQHELDYLNGKVFLDYLSPLKRNFLLKKSGLYK